MLFQYAVFNLVSLSPYGLPIKIRLHFISKQEKQRIAREKWYTTYINARGEAIIRQAINTILHNIYPGSYFLVVFNIVSLERVPTAGLSLST